MRVSEKKIHICLLEMSVVIFVSRNVLCTCLDYIVCRVQMHRSNEVTNAQYSIVVFSSHEKDNCLINITS